MRASRRDIDPRLGLLDFSGYVDAQRIRSQGMQQLGQNIGEAIEGYKTEQENKKFRRSFAEELVSDLNRKNADGTSDPATVRKLEFFNINAGDFGDQNAEQQVDTIFEALEGYDKSRLQTLRDGFSLSELENKQKLDQIREENLGLLDAFKNMNADGDDGTSVVADADEISTKIETIQNNENLPFLDDDVKDKVTEITSKSPEEVTEEDLAVLNTIENQLKVIPRRSETGAMGMIADLPSNLMGMPVDIVSEILNLRRPEDKQYSTQFSPDGSISPLGGSDSFRQLPRYTVQPAKSLYNYLGFE